METTEISPRDVLLWELENDIYLLKGLSLTSLSIFNKEFNHGQVSDLIKEKNGEQEINNIDSEHNSYEKLLILENNEGNPREIQNNSAYTSNNEFIKIQHTHSNDHIPLKKFV